MDQNLARVNATIGAAVIGFYRHRLSIEKPEFHADELRAYIATHTNKTAPGSPDRILRLKKSKGELNYTLLDRRRSLYRFEENLETPSISPYSGTNPSMDTR